LPIKETNYYALAAANVNANANTNATATAMTNDTATKGKKKFCFCHCLPPPTTSGYSSQSFYDVLHTKIKYSTKLQNVVWYPQHLWVQFSITIK
jgi:hypothetical protein